ncbi:MAG: hypothetical protein SFU83_03395 [Meiothermus sp.]|nr:hypothetical protein [Meiothermus sp.]
MTTLFRVLGPGLLALLAACGSGANDTINTEPFDPNQPRLVTFNFLSALHSGQHAQARGYILPAELDTLNKIVRITRQDEAVFWGKVAREYTLGCPLSAIAVDKSVLGPNSAKVDYTLTSSTCLPISGSTNLSYSQGRWFLTFVKTPLEAQEQIHTLTLDYAQAVYQAARDALSANPSLGVSSLATEDCTKGYAAGGRLVTVNASLLASCRVAAVGSGLLVSATNLLGRTVTAPPPSN